MDCVILNSIQASFHQGYVNIFGSTSGREWSCKALYALALSSLKVIHRWKQEDLYLVFFLEDKLYKGLNT